MEKIWKLVNGLNLKIPYKNSLYLGILMLFSLVIGALAWGLIGRLFLPGIDWLFCFILFAVIFGGFNGGMHYLANHEFK